MWSARNGSGDEGDREEKPDLFWLAGRWRLFGLDDFFQRILEFHCAVAGYSWLQLEHSPENHWSGLATGIDAFYSAESGNDSRFAYRVTASLLRDSAR